MRYYGKKYEFRKRLLKVHKDNIRKPELVANADDFEILDGAVITLLKNAGEVIETAAKDFIDYLFTSMNISARIGKDGCIDFEVAGENPDRATEFEIFVDEKIRISAIDERSASQALFYLEDIMNERKAPLFKKGEITKKLSFSPRIIWTSGYSKARLPITSILHMIINTDH